MTNIYVGNLDYSTPEDQLQSLFAAYGAVKTVTAVMDRDTGQPRGFAFVEMPNDEEAAKAIAGLDGKAIGGRNLKVNEARPKDSAPRPRTSGFGGSRNGGGNREKFSNEDYRESARQPREPRW
jgi:cold-inducible RNA-binding protein